MDKIKKGKENHAAAQKKYRRRNEQHEETYKAEQSKRIEIWRKKKVSSMNSAQHKAYKRAAAERKRKSREKKRQVVICPTSSDVTESRLEAPYKKPQSLGKAIRRTMRSLPESPRKKKAVVMGLAKAVGVQLTNEMEKNVSISHTNSLNKDVVELIRNFYFQPDITYHCSGMKEDMVIWKNGKKMRVRKLYLTMYLKEAHEVFKLMHKDIICGFAKFSELRPENVLLMRDTPTDQCRCKIHDNFILKLKGLRITYSQSWWQTALCDPSENSACWTDNCMDCKDGKKLQSNTEPEEKVSWQQWEQMDGRLQKNLKKGCCWELLKSIQDDFPKFKKHVLIKRRQSHEFFRDTRMNDVRVLQVDFVMSYSCEYQNEVQSALWSRKLVTLFTAAVFCNGTCKTYLICSDTHLKNKDTVSVFLCKLYEIILESYEEGDFQEVIWSDGPSSEFKNKFICKFLSYLSAKYQRTFQWKYTATSHGKGVVDGVGGLAKSMVRREVMAKHGDLVVQSALDFQQVASKLLNETTVIYIPQSEIDIQSKNLNLWKDGGDVHPVAGIRNIHILKMSENGELSAYWDSHQPEPCVLIRYQEAEKPNPYHET